MNSRDELKQEIIENFERMTDDQKKEFIARVKEDAKLDETQEIFKEDLVEYSIRQRLIDSIESFGAGNDKPFELVTFIMSMSFITLEITRSLLEKRKGSGDIQIDDLRDVLSRNNDLVHLVHFELAAFLSFIFDFEFLANMVPQNPWNYPHPLAHMFNDSKLMMHLGAGFVIDESIFRK